MEVVVTGGAGAIGTNLSKYLAANGIRVHVIDNLSSGFERNLENTKNVVLHRVDVADEGLFDLLKHVSPQYIFHLAALFANERSLIEPETDLRTTCLATINLLRIAEEKRVSKVIFASSSSIYGSQKAPIKEDQVFNSQTTPYALTKRAAENYLHIFKIGRAHV